jgi:transforming growth factor-beta-induced protein
MTYKSLVYLFMPFVLFLSFTACSDDTATVITEDPTILEIAGSNDNFTILVDAVVNTGLDATLAGSGPFTVFAPTNDAFEALPEGLLASLTDDDIRDILLYHVLGAEVSAGALQPTQSVLTAAGGEIFITVDANGVTVNGNSSVTAADLFASNGVIHVINEVLIPDALGTIAANAQKRYFLTELVDALVATDLVGAVADPEAELTVFAPSNEAFEAIADVAAGLTPEELANILLYHVIDARVLSGNLQGEQTVTTLNGQDITITVQSGVVSINGQATVTSADVDGTNGVIHVIDSVLLPPGE